MNKNKFRQNKEDRQYERFNRALADTWKMVNSLINLKKEINRQKLKENGKY